MTATLETYLRNAVNSQAKVRVSNTLNPKGEMRLRLDVRSLGKPTYTVFLEGDRIITTDDVKKEMKRQRPKKSASQQTIEKGVKEAVS